MKIQFIQAIIAGDIETSERILANVADNEKAELINAYLDQNECQQLKPLPKFFLYGNNFPLLYAIRSHHLDMAAWLIKQGAAVNFHEPLNGNTPLHIACALNHNGIVKLLIHANADVNKRTTAGTLQQVEPNLQVGTAPIHTAVEVSDIEVAESLLAAGANVNEQHGAAAHITPLFVATEHKFPDMMQFLIDRGAIIDIKSKETGDTPLFKAIDSNCEEAVRCLVENGANIHHENKFGQTPLWVAASHGHINIVKYLIEKGANINAADNLKRTPFWMACYQGHLEVIQYLWTQKDNIDMTTPSTENNTAFEIALKCDQLAVVELLLSQQAVLASVKQRKARSTKLLFAAFAKARIYDYKNKDAWLMLAYKTIQSIDHDYNIRSSSSLQQAIAERYIPAIDYLLTIGGGIFTALHINDNYTKRIIQETDIFNNQVVIGMQINGEPVTQNTAGFSNAICTLPQLTEALKNKQIDPLFLIRRCQHLLLNDENSVTEKQTITDIILILTNLSSLKTLCIYSLFYPTFKPASTALDIVKEAHFQQIRQTINDTNNLLPADIAEEIANLENDENHLHFT